MQCKLVLEVRVLLLSVIRLDVALLLNTSIRTHRKKIFVFIAKH